VESGGRGGKLIYETYGRYDDIITPFYRSIKSFFSRTVNELHWPKTDKKQIAILTAIVKGAKTKPSN
jgi:hypothetical protein